MRALLTAVLGLLTLTVSARAGDRLDVQRVAFSPEGARVLVLWGGVQDGSGLSVARLSVLDTASGRPLYAASARSTSESAAWVRDWLWRSEETALGRLGVRSSRAAQPVYARAFPRAAPVWTEGTRGDASTTTLVRLWSRPVPVRLTVRALPSRCAFPEMLPEGERPAGFILTVNGQTVHADRSLPPDRECAARYALDRVYVQGNRAVFIIRAYTPGFEGPNADVVTVAAQLR
ncbi:DUF2259 domain-containing protein [Deinococcus sp. YIM 77859]|uniref:DUF2259 domain-containing protein n=1 Tax=Deinococcus sp. YIM 77859 TaxID=1540221 RepID=UPI000552E111|nr:DUF2259 domain-containing protein [Deinococcus sp. YIM 77859]